MIKQVIASVCLSLLLFTFAQAQSEPKMVGASWEVLVVGPPQFGVPEVRTFNFLAAGRTVDGLASLEWMAKSGWELVGVSDKDEKALYFKRRYDESRTEAEILRLQKSLAAVRDAKPDPSGAVLIDLDAAELAAKLDDQNRADDARFRKAVAASGIDGLRIVATKVRSTEPGRTALGATIVFDATSRLITDGVKYRASEAEKVLEEIIGKLVATDDFRPGSWERGSAGRISKGGFKWEIGDVPFANSGQVNIKIAVVVKQNGREIPVAMSILYTNWKPATK